MKSQVLIVALCLLGMGCQQTPEQTPAATPQPSTTQIEQGHALFKRYGCAVCHGKSGHGDGQIARTLNPRPRDFHDPSAYKFGRSIDAIARTIEKGALNERGMGMPGYPQIPEEERKTIAAFLVSLQNQPK